MKNNEPLVREKQAAEESAGTLDRIIKEGARKLLQEAIEHEVSVYVDMFKDLKDDKGRRLVVRHGSLPERDILSQCRPSPGETAPSTGQKRRSILHEYDTPPLHAPHPFSR